MTRPWHGRSWGSIPHRSTKPRYERVYEKFIFRESKNQENLWCCFSSYRIGHSFNTLYAGFMDNFYRIGIIRITFLVMG